jgi:nicotinamidase-related amidase
MSEWTLVGKTALLVVHMQNSVCKLPSPLEPLGHWRVVWEDGIVPKIRALQSAFRAKGMPVIFVVTYTPPDARVPVYGAFWPGAKALRANFIGTPDVEVIEELAPAPCEPVFFNWPFDIFQGNEVQPFQGRGLEQYLVDQGIDTVVLTGVATGMSLGTAAFALAGRFYNLIVPSDATADADRELHETIIKGMIPAIGLVTTADDVIEHI